MRGVCRTFRDVLQLQPIVGIATREGAITISFVNAKTLSISIGLGQNTLQH